MMIIPPYDITEVRRFFLEPRSPLQRQYEAMRAYYIEELSASDAAERFGYTYGSFRVLCHQFSHNLERNFFREPRHGPTTQPKKDPARELIIAARKRNLSVVDIQFELQAAGHRLSRTAIWEVLRDEGFSRLPRRRDDERPGRPRPLVAPVVDIRQFEPEWKARRFQSSVAGLFLLVPLLVRLQIDRAIRAARLPGTKMVPSTHAVRATLALKLLGTDRKSHIMDQVFDQGLSLMVGLNAMPKTTWLSQYSNRLGHNVNMRLLSSWLDALEPERLLDNGSFNLDFHSIPFFGEHEAVEKNYVSMRSRRQKSILTFMAQNADSNIFCYCNADVRKGEEADEVMRFVEYWKDKTGHYPRHLVFDSQLTTYATLDKLRALDISFITLRRRSPKLLAEVASLPRSAWQTVELDLPQRKYKTPKVIEKMISLKGYKGQIRQLYIKDLGHDQPTILIARDTATKKQLITRYAQRMLIENGLADCIDFFHLNSLSSAVALKVDYDVVLTVIASGIYRLMARRIRGYETAEPRTLFRRFLDSSGRIEITDDGVTVHLAKRAHHPLLVDAGVLDEVTAVPWWANRTLRFALD